ncbi:MAG: acyl-CoA thioesterase II [Gammaproteobacteria bacterium]|jgi:acyl-CoA thioesterase-2|nr:acyl-CoA thioesterase II [Gammaproteobacteria bacterium]MBT5216121.1 acyl-CoA thioesterase II [Gammaproteobacteria bacterium]MBT5542737.1 acyl-CoA thioesterase II [Gammaproteobacteria bacterium]MBT6073658.1 acyl-CoA thioesterase II [Gammaproteobacteria bacterium]MBT7753680.1 acyl-CoA thioesterase II [Gammaproteobacteria bacterium]
MNQNNNLDTSIERLVSLLDLEDIEKNIFRGESQDIGSPQVFGGQVLGQALMAASRTVVDRNVHSLHAYFLRRGDFEAPIVYEVDRARDGGSFSNRRVIAVQHGEQIFNMTSSFQVPEDGLEHQSAMPNVPPPEELEDLVDLIKPEWIEQLPLRIRRMLTRERPFEVKPVETPHFLINEVKDPIKHSWIRAKGSMSNDIVMHQALLAYVSDYDLLTTAILPHGTNLMQNKFQMASLDHAMWFHNTCAVDQWLLFAYESPRSNGSRGFARAQIFSRDGVLIASTSQEGLMRVRRT